jgi:hypothetical protein
LVVEVVSCASAVKTGFCGKSGTFADKTLISLIGHTNYSQRVSELYVLPETEREGQVEVMAI